ncbi:methyltransferase domain-containing protein [Diaporthe helianthi]|uniref:Methyltransferase domain-containing protein n=1 Tax=Diaporthe helianthi TaxID=158607 RepID=A0A2P5IF86_DIAHE|nr:methyltransferase domain-containing protein [Diaporthe helianthi]
MGAFLSLLSLLRASIAHRLARGDKRPTTAGAAVYSPLFLNLVYDGLVLGLYCTYVWRCPAKILQNLYNTLVAEIQNYTANNAYLVGSDSPAASKRILDVGVGTGYFLASTPLPESTSVTLFDLNPACLEAASLRCKASHTNLQGLEVKTVCGDFLAPADDPNSIHQKLVDDQQQPDRFDVIMTSFLLHCVPGPPQRKARALASLAKFVEPKSGVLAGATILGDRAEGVQHNIPGRFIMFWHNALGMFDNRGDDVVSFVGALQNQFHDVKWEIVGTVLLFQARLPKGEWDS